MPPIFHRALLLPALVCVLLAACASPPPEAPPASSSSVSRKVYPPPQAAAPPPVAPDVQQQRLDHLQATLSASLRGQDVELSRVANSTLLLRIPGTMAFAANDAKPQPALLPVLDKLAAALNQEPGTLVTIEGHTDSLGREIFNQTLSVRRADQVVAYLASRGVAFDRLTAAGRGESQPIADNATENGRARNRRVDILITGG